MEGRVVVSVLALLVTGCAAVVHGPYEDVFISSEPAGAVAEVTAQTCERGPAFLDKRKLTFQTPASVRLKRDNSYRIEVRKPGYKIGTAWLEPSYDWLWAPEMCGPCEALGESGIPIIGTWGRGVGGALRIFSPDALLGTAFKLKKKDAGFFANWHGLGTPRVHVRLEPLQ